jgi:phage tail protein X
MTTYTTKQGDMWDQISYDICDSPAAIIPLMQANPQYSDINIFPAGIELTIPDVDTIQDPDYLPPWMEDEED